jgi:lipoprotein-anchoring transpeptidase ErfK/SrfK
MDRRYFLIALASSASLATPVLADRADVRYNFRSVFSTSAARGSYRGKRVVDYKTAEKPGTIIVDTSSRKLFYVLGAGRAIEYGIGVGRQGFEWSGTARIGNKAEWPQWRPPAEMIARELRQYGRQLPAVMEGGPNNPLGARALYLYQGSRDTLYRIHGTNAPATIGQAVSSGCIRLVNEEVIDLFNRARIGAKVIVL